MIEKYDPFIDLRTLLDEYSSNTPIQILHSTSPNNKSKFRGNWWTGAQAHAENILRFCYTEDPEIIEACHSMLKLTEDVWGREPDLYDQKFKFMCVRVTQDDVFKAEEIIRRILK